MKNKLKFAGVTDIRVTSAGLSATDGDKMSKNSAKALRELGYKPVGFKSKMLTSELLNRASMVLCMTATHKSYLHGFSNVYTIAEVTGLNDILDPYGGSLSTYIKTSHQLEDACNIILEKILEVKGE